MPFVRPETPPPVSSKIEPEPEVAKPVLEPNLVVDQAIVRI